MRLISNILRLWPVFFIVYGIAGLAIVHTWWFVLPLVFGLIGFFKGSLNALYILGPLFWITKPTISNICCGIGYMHQISKPWKKGIGIYFGVAKRVFLIGFCKKQDLSETEGILSAVQGRYLDTPPSEIGTWGDVEKAG